MRIFFLSSLLCLAAVAMADVVHLTDGSRLEGQVRKDPDGWTVTAADGKVRHVATERVQMIEATGKTTSDSKAAESRLQSLRQVCETMTDARAALERYRQFMEQSGNAAMRDEAKKDVVVWQDRLDRNLVRVGSNWMTLQQREELRSRSSQAAMQAGELIGQGKLKDADVLLREASANDPGSAAVLYVRGLLLYQQEQLPAARKCFESVVAIAPEHAPTLNNLSVILWRQNQHGLALNYYDRAMLANPLNRTVLNNMAEAINAMPASQKGTAVEKKARRHFEEQDNALREQMRQLGRFRWGSTWVSQEELDRLLAIQRETDSKRAVMANEYDAARGEIERIGREIEDNNRTLRKIESDSWMYDSRGRLFRLPYPSIYYELQRDNQRLAGKQVEIASKLDRLKESAKQIQDRLPVQPYTGIHRLIGMEGVPNPVEVSGNTPTTHP